VAVEIAGLTELTALDRDPELLAECRRRVARRDMSVTLVARDVLALGSGQRFDLIIAPAQFIQIIGEADERARLWEQIVARLEPGGLVAVTYVDADVALQSGQDFGATVSRRVGAHIYRSTELPAFALGAGVAVPWERALTRTRRHGSQRASRLSGRTTYAIVTMLYARVSDTGLRREGEGAGLRYIERRDLPSATHLPAAVLIFSR
jgi:hypothetical protein